MSGIFGAVNLAGEPEAPAALERTRNAVAHRGPDGSRTWIDGELGFGHLMLHSTPESLHEILPWEDPETGLAMNAAFLFASKVENSGNDCKNVRRDTGAPNPCRP